MPNFTFGGKSKIWLKPNSQKTHAIAVRKPHQGRETGCGTRTLHAGQSTRRIAFVNESLGYERVDSPVTAIRYE
ncbi:hypothetical protein RBWH47_05963 [Rhodopirellula baltica WH47]|uniref:Uncharacterized protein n=1 Tax=Rhodopirellula baltica WH47 TaxID=991778 RepID=F2AWQ6_RHOBT|nr:hypothetical protein RBWH47_05963 [Rhodopirellula baltica WH47]